MRWVSVGILVGGVIAAAPVYAAERATSTATCRATTERFVYECTFHLKNARTGAPLTDAEIVVGADMPSMPMAHSVTPATAVPTGIPGRYVARIRLEMFGNWALHLTIGGPLRDRLIEILHFDADGAVPVRHR